MDPKPESTSVRELESALAVDQVSREQLGESIDSMTQSLIQTQMALAEQMDDMSLQHRQCQALAALVNVTMSALLNGDSSADEAAPRTNDQTPIHLQHSTPLRPTGRRPPDSR